MALFGKGKSESKEVKNTKTADTSAQALGQEQVSPRLAGVFASMYTLVLSADVTTNVYSFESGKVALQDPAVPVRGCFENLIQTLADQVLEEKKEQFITDFKREELVKHFRAGKGTLSKNYPMKKSVWGVATDSEEEIYGWYEFRADRLVAKNNHLLLIIFVRPAQAQEDFVVKPAAETLETSTESATEAQKRKEESLGGAWNLAGVQRLFTKRYPMFAEYIVAEDKMLVYKSIDGKRTVREMQHYLGGLEQRGDFTVFHEDNPKVREILRRAMKGEVAEDVVRVRENGIANAPFKNYRMQFAPAQKSATPSLLLGTLYNEESVDLDTGTNDVLTNQMNHLMANMYSEVYQVDLDTDRIWRIRNKKGGYEREENARRFSEVVLSEINRGIIHKDHAAERRKWITRGYLKEETARGVYVVESKKKIAGSLEYLWYSDTFIRQDGKENGYIVLCRCEEELRSRHANDFMDQEAKRLFNYNEALLGSFASLVEFRNVETGAHLSSVRQITMILLNDIAERSPHYNLTQKTINLYGVASFMHDVGKITIPDAILNKPGRFTPEEYAVMKTHTTNGAKIIENMQLPDGDEMKEFCRDVALHHHERFDGKGYPEGLVGDANNIGVQAIGLADAYDALVSTRCYKDSFQQQEAKRMINDGECGMFNPRLLASFNACWERIAAIYENN